MKKALLIVAMMLLCASTAFAEAKFSMTGSYWAEGKYWFNYNPGPGTDATYNDTSFGFYEQDINLFPKITIDNTSLNFKVAITDVYWGDPEADGSEGINQADDDASADDDNIQIERAFLSHKFNDKVSLDVGLMDGTVWGTSFADDKQAQWRVKLTTNTAVGVLGFVLEKNLERGVLATDDVTETRNAEGENSDRDSYGIFGVTKAGSVYIKPLLWYVDSMNDETGFTVFNPVLAFNGDLGAVSFEAEFNYKMYETKLEAVNYDEDFSTLGIYVNLWKAMEKMTPGIIVAYGSYDEDSANAAAAMATAVPATAATMGGFAYFAGFDFEDDFDSSIILGDEYCWGGTGDDLRGMTMIKLYVNDIKTSLQPLTLFGYFNYVMSNQEDTAYEDATAWELALGSNYKITDNLNYSVYGAYADISYDVTGIDDPDSVYLLANSVTFSF